MAAWKTACEAAGPSTITVPKGDYLVNDLEFLGPCKGPVTLEMNGNLKAPTTVDAKPNCGWIDFTNLVDFTLNGNGAIFDGQGSLAWKANDCAKTGKCNSLPIVRTFTCIIAYNINVITISSLVSLLYAFLVTERTIHGSHKLENYRHNINEQQTFPHEHSQLQERNS